MTVIWFVVLEISTATDRFLFSPWAIFCPLPPSPLENKNIKKMKKNAWRYHQDIIKISQAYQKSYHRLYCYWDMECDGCNSYLWFWAIFCTFTPITAQKIKNSKKTKQNNSWRYHHFTQVYQKSWLYALLFLRYGMWQM